MLVNIDVKNLEWVTVVWFSQDPVGMVEIHKGVDQHSGNQQAFGLPDRTTAKIFVFRLIYGGSKWSYALDPNFNWISKDPKFWQGVIDKFYEKYKGIATQHAKWIREATTTGKLVMPTGRTYTFQRYQNKRGEWEWPRTQILNYPVQGTGHDLVTIARVSLWKRVHNDPLLKHCVLFVSTVHDSIVLDVDSTTPLQHLCNTINGVFNDVPINFRKLFGVEFNLPIRGEITVGPNLLDMKPI